MADTKIVLNLAVTYYKRLLFHLTYIIGHFLPYKRESVCVCVCMSVCRVGCGMSEPTGSDNMDQNKDSIYDCTGQVTWTEFY